MTAAGATLGLIGGIGPESTIEYYRALLAAYRERHGNGTAPSILINSIDVNRVLALMGAGDRAALTEMLVAEIGRLARAGASLAIIAANTPHAVFGEVQSRAAVPLLSIVTATRDAVQAGGWTRVALFGTRFTMAGRFYPDVFAAAGLELVPPSADDQAFIHDIYTTELLRNIFLPETNDALVRIIERMKRDDRIEAVILGGTELPLILRGDSAAGLPLLDTTRIHARAAVDRLWSSSP